MSIIEMLKQYALDYCLELDDAFLGKLEIYAQLLREWNEKINLTAILDDEGIAQKHFLDCIMVGESAVFEKNSKVIDVGTGAGFPGLVLAARFPEVSVTLLDSTGKKLKAVEDIAKNMGVTNVEIVHARAEEAGKKPDFREQYDFATARAVAELRVLLEYALPFVKVGGEFLSLKGAAAEREILDAKNALGVLGGRVVRHNMLDLPNGDRRSIVCVKKISQIPIRYPRVSAQIAKKPL